MRGMSAPSLSSTAACALLLVYFMYLSPALALYCAHCQHFDPGCRYGYYRARECDDPASTHCYTVRLFVGIGYGTFRGCTTWNDNRDDCRGINIRNRTGVQCTQLCDWNGCNSAIQDPRPWEK